MYGFAKMYPCFYVSLFIPSVKNLLATNSGIFAFAKINILIVNYTMNTPKATLYLIPTVLAELEFNCLPHYLLPAIKDCTVFFVENERTTRRFFKSIYKEMVIDDYQWITIHKAEATVKNELIKHLQHGATIGIVSEAGCPAIADPGQLLVAAAQQFGAVVKPLVGPSSILLSLMASGFNGQNFTFNGYLPIDNLERNAALKVLEVIVTQHNTTQLFIETPYRNNQLLESILKICQPTTLLCIATNLTSITETVVTKSIHDWKKAIPNLHKQPTIFLLGS